MLHCLDLETDVCIKNQIEKNMIHYFIGKNVFVTSGWKN